MGQDNQVDNQRIARRQRVLKQGKIVFFNNLSVTDCTIRDLSETGAKVICGDQMAVPNEFRLVVLMDNTIRDVQVAWRRKHAGCALHQCGQASASAQIVSRLVRNGAGCAGKWAGV